MNRYHVGGGQDEITKIVIRIGSCLWWWKETKASLRRYLFGPRKVAIIHRLVDEKMQSTPAKDLQRE
jgi:hypothetical protein